MKRKITLGLMVFFVGVLITACGGKKSSTNNNVTNNTPTTVTPFNPDDACVSQGFCQQIGDYQITDQTGYGQVFPGYNNGPQNIVQSPWDDQGANWGGFWSSFRQAALSCVASTAWARLIAELTGDSSAECNVGFSNTRNYVPTDGLATSYPVTLNQNYSNSILTTADLYIQDGTNGGNGRVIEFYPQDAEGYNLRGNYNNQDLVLQWNGAGYDMLVPSGQIGRLNNLR